MTGWHVRLIYLFVVPTDLFSSFRYRSLLAVLLALSLLMPHFGVAGPLSAAVGGGSGNASAMSTVDERAPLRQDLREQASDEGVGGWLGAHAGEGTTSDFADFGDLDPGDHPQEMDKILSLFSLSWGSSAPPWGSPYAGGAAPEPVFSFERPPKPFAA